MIFFQVFCFSKENQAIPYISAIFLGQVCLCIHITDQIKHFWLAGLGGVCCGVFCCCFFLNVCETARFWSRFFHQQYPFILSAFALSFCSFFSCIFTKSCISFQTTGLFHGFYLVWLSVLRTSGCRVSGGRGVNISMRFPGIESEGPVF